MKDNNQELVKSPIAELCSEFESTWKPSEDSIEKFLLARKLSQLEEKKILVHLIRSEIELLRRTGGKANSEEYGKRFPQLSPEVIDDLIAMPALPPLPTTRGNVPLMPNRYRVVEKIGKGGIGSVWRVEDREMKRPLAAKILLDRFKRNQAANVRLEREAMLAGSLQHPGIPPVFEFGDLLTGSKFFTMKLVEGKTLDELLRQRKSVADDRPYFLGVFRQIAEAVGFAHSKRVIHRDLKPQNIMVGEFGEVQIMDWGVAKQMDENSSRAESNRHPTPAPENPLSRAGRETNSASLDSSLADASGLVDLDNPDLTLDGDVIGTPYYMSPEQAQGDLENLTEQTDVFSLGAILFEILTGRSLYDRIPTSHLVDAASNCELADTLERLYDSDADEGLLEICHRCLKKDPQLRPAGGREVANSITTYLDGVEIRLRQAEIDRTSADVRALGEKKRRQTFVKMAICVGLIGLLGAAGIVWQWSLANQNLKEASRQSAAREVYFSKSLEAIDKMLTRVGYETLADVPGMGELRRELLQEALTFYQEFVTVADDDDRLNRELAKVLKLMGTTHGLLGDYPNAEESFSEAIDLLDNLIGESHDGHEKAELELELASCQVLLGDALLETGKADRSAEQLRLALSILDSELDERELLDDQWRARKRIAVAQARLVNASVMNSTAGENSAREELKLTRVAFDAIPPEAIDDRLRVSHATCLAELGRSLRSIKQVEDANELAEQAVEIMRDVVTRNPQSPAFRNTLINLLQEKNASLSKDGFFEESSAGFGEQLEIQKQLVNDFPNLPQLKNDLVRTYALLGAATDSLGRKNDALKLFETGVELGEELVADFPETISHLQELSYIYQAMALAKRNLPDPEHRSQSARETNRSYELAQQILAITPENPDLKYQLAVAAQNNSQSVFNDMNLSDSEAESRSLELNLESESILKSLLNSSPENTNYQYRLAYIQTNLSGSLSLEDPNRAKALLRESAAGFERLINLLPESPQFRFQLARAQDAQALLLFKLDQKEESEILFQAANNTMQAASDKFGVNARITEFVTISQNRLGHCRKALGRLEEAEELFKSALDSRLAFYNQDLDNENLRRKVGSANTNLAWLFSIWYQEEKQDLELALQHANVGVEFAPDSAEAWMCLAYINLLRKDHDAVNAAFEKVNELEVTDPLDDYDQMTRAAIKSLLFQSVGHEEQARTEMQIASELAETPEVLEYWDARLTHPEGLLLAKLVIEKLSE